MKKKISVAAVWLLTLVLASYYPLDYPRGDVDRNGEVNIADVTALIDYLLNGQWPDGAPRPEAVRTFTVHGVSFNMVSVEGGTFMMGATEEQGSDTYSNEKPVHEVTLSGYSIGQTEVTQELWAALMDPVTIGSCWGHPQWPVTAVTEYEIKTFITRLNEATGENFRLPTEAEWEFAARGGNYSMGYKYAGSDTLYDVAWCYPIAGERPHPVGLLLPNELGLYDMTGNVSEMCQDWYGDYSSEAQTDPTGPETGSSHVTRGGSWSNYWGRWWISWRGKHGVGDHYGIRLALSEQQNE